MKISNIRKNLIVVLVITFLMIFSTISIGAQGSFTISKSSVTLTVGQTTTFSINVTDCEGRFDISSSDSSIVKVSSSSEWIDSSKSITLTALKAGTAKITITASNVSDTSENDVTGSKTISITVKEKTTTENTTGGNNTNTGGNTNNSTSGGSTSNEYKPTFTTVNETVYATDDVNVRKSYSTSSTKLGTLSKGDSITRTGKSTDGKWSKVTYNGQTAYISSSYLSTTKPKEEEKSSNKNLASLSIEGVELTPKFNKEIIQYTGTASENVTKLAIKATAEDSKAKVEILNNDNLKGGDNIIKIKVTAEDDTARTYTLIITNPTAGKIDENKTIELQLATLEIKGVNFEEGFNPAIYTYELSLNNSEIKNLEITAKANQEDATVEIIGNENFIVGENTITILLTSADGTKTATYQIKVTLPAETAKEVKVDGIFQTAGYIIAGIIIATIIIIIILFIINHYKRKVEDKEDDDNTAIEKNKISSKTQDEDMVDIPQIGEKTKRSKGKHSI